MMQVQLRHKVILERCLSKLIMRLQWSAFQGWRAAAEAARLQSVALARFEARCIQAHQRRAFQQCVSPSSQISWIAVVHLKATRENDLKIYGA